MWHAIQVFFGFSPGDGNDPAYLFWSGVGSDLAYLSFLWGAVVLYRTHTCRVRWCARLGRHEFPDPETGVKRILCWKHHPDVQSKQMTRKRLRLYLGERPGKG